MKVRCVQKEMFSPAGQPSYTVTVEEVLRVVKNSNNCEVLSWSLSCQDIHLQINALKVCWSIQFFFYTSRLHIIWLMLLLQCFRFQGTRPALSVTIYPLFDQDTAYVMNKIPTKHLEELTIFSSKICQQPPGQCRVKAKTRDRSGKVTVWPWPQASGQASWPWPKASVKLGTAQKMLLWPWPFVRVKPGQLEQGDCVMQGQKCMWPWPKLRVIQKPLRPLVICVTMTY